MSEKRFRANFDVSIYDSEKEEYISASDGLKEIAKRMNEQQATIEAKNEYQRTLEAKIRRLKNRIKILEKAEGWQN